MMLGFKQGILFEFESAVKLVITNSLGPSIFFRYNHNIIITVK